MAYNGVSMYYVQTKLRYVNYFEYQLPMNPLLLLSKHNKTMLTPLMSKEEAKKELKRMVLEYCQVKGVTELEAIRMAQAELQKSRELKSEQKKEQLHKQVLRICKEQNLTELEVLRIMQHNLPAFVKANEKKPID